MWCGFYWHSTRIARDGTNLIFNSFKQMFQERQTDNKIDWTQCRDLLFMFKKELDTKYRNMFWHFTHARDCSKCRYWDDVYTKHMAGVSPQGSEEEISDQDMMRAAEEVDASS